MFWGNFFFFFAIYFENFQLGPIKFQNISFQIGCQESEKKRSGLLGVILRNNSDFIPIVPSNIFLLPIFFIFKKAVF